MKSASTTGHKTSDSSSYEREARRAFQIRSADGTTLEVPGGEFYMNTKDRCRRKMVNSLSSEVRQIDAAIELATMGFRQELAVVMTKKGKRPMTPTDLVEATGIAKQNVRRALREWEDAGLGECKSDDGGPLRNGHILIYSWSTPRPPKTIEGNRAHLPSNVFPTTCSDLEAFARRNKYQLPEGLIVAPDCLPMLEEVSRKLQEVHEAAARALEGIGARRLSIRKRQQKENERKKVSESEPEPADHSPTQALIAAAVEQEFGAMESGDPLRDEFEQLPAAFEIPAAAVADAIRDKIREKRRKGYLIDSHGALLRFVRQGLPAWISQNAEVIRRYRAADGPQERRSSASPFSAPEDFDPEPYVNGRVKGAGA